MIYKYFLLLFRKFYKIYFNKFLLNKFRKKYILENDVILNTNKASKILYKVLKSNKPYLITRFGRHEIDILLNYMGIKTLKFNSFDFIKCKIYENWWHSNKVKYLKNNAGFYPVNFNNLKKFSKLYLSKFSIIDILSVYTYNPKPEDYFHNELRHTLKISLECLDIFSSQSPWTHALKNKKILVISPFAKTIIKQYTNRNLIFKNERLPKFKLLTLNAVQSAGGNNKDFKNWFDALNDMKSKMKKIDFDIAIIGCGAYGFPLAAYAKELGKIGLHLGGELQTIFGILGKRFENPNYKNGIYLKFINKYWVRPSIEERPKNYKNIENGCYW